MLFKVSYDHTRYIVKLGIIEELDYLLTSNEFTAQESFNIVNLIGNIASDSHIYRKAIINKSFHRIFRHKILGV